MEVRLTSGLRAGDVVEVDDSVGQAFLVSGKAVPAEEASEVAEVEETPEKPAVRKGRRKAAEAPETR